MEVSLLKKSKSYGQVKNLKYNLKYNLKSNLKHKLKSNLKSNVNFSKPLMNPRTGEVLSINDVQMLNNVLFISLAVLLLSTINLHSFADPLNGTTDIFNMEAFIGNTKWFEKLNFVGAIVQAFISIGGWVAAIVVAVQAMITLLYFGNPQLWDNVNEVKQSKKGLISYSASIFPTDKGKFMGNLSNGSDIILDYLILCAPNIKRYSENSDDTYESLGVWFMSTFFKKCILLLCISMMINGSFMKLYSVVVDGLGVVAERFVETDSQAIVNRLLNTGSNYEFTLGTTGKGVDSVQGATATKIYKEIVKTSANVDTDSKYTIGSNIEKYVKKTFTEKSIREKLIGVSPDYSMTEKDWERVTVKVVMNGTNSSTNGFDIDASELGLESTTSSGQKRYMHVYFQAGRAVDTTKYFGVPGAADQ